MKIAFPSPPHCVADDDVDYVRMERHIGPHGHVDNRAGSRWRAAYSLDGYSTTIDKWLDGAAADDILDYVPSVRIRNYLSTIRESGTVPELKNYGSPQYERALRLRAIRGIGVSQAAKILFEPAIPSERWLSDAAAGAQMLKSELLEVLQGSYGIWQSGHIVPPLVRLLHALNQRPVRSSICDATSR